MRISRNGTGRLNLVLSKEEREAVPGPYKISIADDKSFIVLYTARDGVMGHQRDNGEWQVSTNSPETRKLPEFGTLPARVQIGTGKMTIVIPTELTKPRTVVRKSAPTVVNNNSPRFSMRELVQQINARKSEAPNDMVFSINKDGFLVVTVEYS